MLKERKKILLSIGILFLLINIYSIHGLEGLNVFNDDLTNKNSCGKMEFSDNSTKFFGHVYDYDTKKSIPYATIIALYASSEYDVHLTKTETDKYGYYSIKNYFIEDHYYNSASTPKEDTLLSFILKSGRPTETSIIKGYIKNIQTGENIPDANIVSSKARENITEDFNYTTTDENGYYEINIYNGSFAIGSWTPGYVNNRTYMIINESEVIWINFSLNPFPITNSTIQGYIKNIDNGNIIIGANIDITWKDNYGLQDTIKITNDANGFYKIKIPSGNVTMIISHSNYQEEYLGPITINEDETKWLNFTLTPNIIYYSFNYTWVKGGGEIVLMDNGFVSKNDNYYDLLAVNTPSGSVITDIEFELTWEDDYTHGLLRRKGKDRLEVTFSDEQGSSKTESSIGGGNLTFLFNNINDIPAADSIIAEDITDAIDILEGMIAGENYADFSIEVGLETGEKIIRLFKYLRDKGNDFSLKVDYTYYIYEFEEPY